MRDHAILVDDIDDRVGQSIRRPFHVNLIGLYQLRGRVGQRCDPKLATFGELRQRPDFVGAYDCNFIAEFFKFVPLALPGDRLGFAVGSPIKRTGK